MFDVTLEQFCENNGFDYLIVKSCMVGCTAVIYGFLIIAFVSLSLYYLVVLTFKRFKRGKSNDKSTH